MKYLHVFQNEKFVLPFIEFIENNFVSSEHLFLILGGLSEKEHPLPKQENIVVLDRDLAKKINIFKLSKILNPYFIEAKKIIIHSFIIANIVDFLFLNQHFLEKSNWVIWGGDLYDYKQKNKSLLKRFYLFRKKVIIQKLSGLIALAKGDYELAQKWFGATGRYYECIMYPSNLYKPLDIIDKRNDSTLYIQIGNSADSSNNHLDVFEKLKKYAGQNIEIICPLSYGDAKYAEVVINKGKELFGKKFKPLTEFMAFDEYLQILGKIDIAIFNFKRQQGVGNIVTLLGLGKKVYIHSDTTPWNTFKEIGITVYNANHIDLDKIDDKTREKNINSVKQYFSEENFKNQCNEIYK